MECKCKTNEKIMLGCCRSRLDTIYVISIRIPCTHMQPDSNMKYDAFRDFRNVLRQHVVPYFTLDFRALIKQQWNAISSPFGGVL